MKIGGFFWNIKNALLSVVVLIVIALLTLTIGIILIPCDQKFAFFVGVIASVVATFLTKFIDKFFDNKKSVLKINNISQKFVACFECAVAENRFDYLELKYNMIEIYNDMCEELGNLYFTSEFDDLSVAMDDVVGAISNKIAISDIEKLIKVVKEERKNIF